MEPEPSHPPRRYAVFLSYRHADNREAGRQWANWLHQELEGYEIPADLVGAKNSQGNPIPRNLYPVFRDEEELPADADLTRNISQALENSGLLVVLCSPRAAESRFVANEIRHFKEIGKADRILALMIDGEPNAADDPAKARPGLRADAECLPEPLRYGVAGGDGKIDWSQRTEPIAADVRPEGAPEQGWTSGAAYREALQKAGKYPDPEIARRVSAYEQRLELAKLKVVAGALGVPLGVLTQRDKAMQLRKARQRARALRLWLGAVGALAALALAGGLYAWSQRQQAIAQRRVAETQRQEALKTASATDFAIAGLKLGQEDWAAALAYLADALRKDPQNEKAMVLTVSLLRSPALPVSVMRPDHAVNAARYLPNGVYSASFSPDGGQVLTASENNAAQIWEARTGRPAGPPLPHPTGIVSASFSPDGKRVVTIAGDGQARVWDVRAGQPLGQPLEHADTIVAASFSPDGQWVATASADKTARIWDAGTGRPLSPPLAHDNALYRVSFSADGRKILTVGGDHTIQGGGFAQIWEAPAGRPTGVQVRGPGMNAAQFSPDGARIVTGSWDKTAQLWDAQTGRPFGPRLQHDAGVEFVSFSPDGRRILTIADDDTARIWDARTFQPAGQPLRHQAAIVAANFSPDARRIVTASLDKTAQVWDTATGQPLGPRLRHDGEVYAASFSPDGKWLVTASTDNTARVWSAAIDVPVGAIGDIGIAAAELSADGRRELTVSTDETLRVWDVPTGRLVGQPMKHEFHVNSAHFSPDGERVVTASADKFARIWDVPTSQLSGPPLAHEAGVGSASFSPDGRWVVTAAGNQSVRIWDAKTGRATSPALKQGGEVSSATFAPDGKSVLTVAETEARVWEIPAGAPAGKPMTHANRITFAGFSPDGKRVLTVSWNDVAQVWDARSGNPLGQPMQREAHIYSASFSPDGNRVVTASADDTAQVWDALTGRAEGPPMKHDDGVNSACFSPDGKWVVTASTDTTARVWETQTGRPISLPMAHAGAVKSARFSPDGKWVVTASADHALRVWDARTGQPASPPVIDDEVDSADFAPDGKWVTTTSDRGVRRAWDVIIADPSAPGWLGDLAEATAGKRINSQGALESSPPAPADLGEKLRNLADASDLSRFGRWFAAIDSAARTPSPLSTYPTAELVSTRLRENTTDSIADADRIDPGNPLVLSAAAALLGRTDPAEARFLWHVALHYAQLANEPEVANRVRTAAQSLFPDDPEFRRGAGPAP